MRVFFMASASLGVIGLALGLVLGVGFCLYIEPIQNFISSGHRLRYVPGHCLFARNAPRAGGVGRGGDDFVLHHRGDVRVDIASHRWWASRFDPVEALRYE